ncbi:squalene epoxidase-domain-containing protein [Sphaerosporella brunnea]|uniref:Squalene monooxygenase n=1 Tax=Sphaerosporella brunnea TaxID=1250544 RepID=A0A5J5EQG0_9PEZI|nr:squalene epoxidase-domain-containing protein [Sphaerosporella brunnea]
MASQSHPHTADARREKSGRPHLHHGKFVQKLRSAARRTPNVTLLEATAKDILRDEASSEVLGLTVSADGYASNFRKRCTTRKPVVRSTSVALQLIDVKLSSPNHGYIIIGNNPLVLLYQIGTHETWICHIVAPDLPAQIQSALRKAIEAADQLPNMPNFFLSAQANDTPEMILLGDAMNMRHPLTGGGDDRASNDAYLLSHLLSPSIVPDLRVVYCDPRTF